MKIAMLARADSAHVQRWSAGLMERGHEIFLISNGGKCPLLPGVKITCLPGRSPLAYLYNISRVRSLLRQIKPDIVHAHYATGYGFWGSVQHEAPLVLTVWGSDIEEAFNNKLKALFVRRALRKAKLITSASKFLMERTLSFERSVRNKIHLVPFGVPLPEDMTDSSTYHERKTVEMIFAKAYYSIYAPDVLLEAFAQAYREDSRLRLTMIGGGPEMGKLQNLAIRLGVGEVVRIEGHKEPTEAIRQIRQADIMVMPSRRESFGVAALEALAYGLPVIGTAVGGIPEIIENGVNGLLVPAGEVTPLVSAILRLSADSRLRREMGKTGQKMVREKFSFSRCLDQMEEIYLRGRED